ncbi:MAG: helix-turn-helix domain-containing protein [Bacteriovoracia bacterium]
MFDEDGRSSSLRRKTLANQDESRKYDHSESVFDNRISTTRLLNTKEAAAYLGVTPNALRILVHRGRVKAEKLGHRLKFHIDALKASLQKREVNYGC